MQLHENGTNVKMGSIRLLAELNVEVHVETQNRFAEVRHTKQPKFETENQGRKV